MEIYDRNFQFFSCDFVICVLVSYYLFVVDINVMIYCCCFISVYKIYYYYYYYYYCY